MFHVPFPSSVEFVWLYYLILVGLLLVACYTDVRYMLIPKWLTLPLFTLGIFLNVVRGSWLSMEEKSAWVLSGSNAWIGGVDGFLFALTGFVVGFGLFLFMWVMGVCGGGDVKLFGALGAYVGPGLAILLLAATVILVAVYSMVRLTGVFARRGLRKKAARKKLVYSPALVVSTALVLLWVFRGGLGLLPPRVDRPEVKSERGEARDEERPTGSVGLLISSASEGHWYSD